jgi:hypothetical protein
MPEMSTFWKLYGPAAWVTARCKTGPPSDAYAPVSNRMRARMP